MERGDKAVGAWLDRCEWSRELADENAGENHSQSKGRMRVRLRREERIIRGGEGVCMGGQSVFDGDVNIRVAREDET